MRRALATYLGSAASQVARFCRVGEGTTAVEFALIAPAFLATLIALLQTCAFLFAQMALQNLALEVGRRFMTGQAQSSGWTSGTIQSKICNLPDFPSSLFTCSNLIVVVQTYASFAAANTAAPQLYNNGQPVTTWAYDPGTPGDVMVVQIVYPWSVVSGPLGFVLSNLPNSAAEMMGVTAFRVEPY